MTNLHSLENFMESWWDWSFLNDCFGDSKIRVSDTDGTVEHNHQFLTLETRAPGEGLDRGRWLWCERRVESGVDTIFLLWGQPNDAREMSIFPGGKFAATAETIRSHVKAWYEAARCGQCYAAGVGG